MLMLAVLSQIFICVTVADFRDSCGMLNGGGFLRLEGGTNWGFSTHGFGRLTRSMTLVPWRSSLFFSIRLFGMESRLEVDPLCAPNKAATIFCKWNIKVLSWFSCVTALDNWSVSVLISQNWRAIVSFKPIPTSSQLMDL